jgi:hypothetical protein
VKAIRPVQDGGFGFACRWCRGDEALKITVNSAAHFAPKGAE